MHNDPDTYGQDRAQVRQLAPKVATALGDGWTVGDDEWSSGALLSHADGRRLYFAADWRGTGRVVIGGHYPASDYYYSGGDRPEITVSRARPAEVIAREITRRLLPRYTELLGKVCAYIADREADAAERERAAALLTAAGASTWKRDSGRDKDRIVVHFPRADRYDGGGEIHGHGTVDLALRRLPAELAVAVMKLVSDNPAPADR